ncbi:energy-coupling factor transporter transmembrane protein EcfT [Oerskovia sp. M15]
MRVAYATRGGFLARRDPRAVLFWYALCGLAPWFTYDLTVLAILFVLAAGTALAARIGPLLLGSSRSGSRASASTCWRWSGSSRGRDRDRGIAVITLKLGTVSLVSMAAFVSLDPEALRRAPGAARPADAGVRGQLRIPDAALLIDEFHTIVDGHRLRGPRATRHGLLGWRTARRLSLILVESFYPLMLNTAKRTRTTVEALETKGSRPSGATTPGAASASRTCISARGTPRCSWCRSRSSSRRSRWARRGRCWATDSQRDPAPTLSERA